MATEHYINTGKYVIYSNEVEFQVFPKASSNLEDSCQLVKELNAILEEIRELKILMQDSLAHMENHSENIKKYKNNPDATSQELIQTIIQFEAQMNIFESMDQSLAQLINRRKSLENQLTKP